MVKTKNKNKQNASPKNPTKKRRLHLYVFCWILISGFFGAAIFQQYVKYEKLTQDARRVTQEIEKEDKLAAELNKELKYYESDAYIEKIAREKLDLVTPDEKIFYNTSDD